MGVIFILRVGFFFLPKTITTITTKTQKVNYSTLASLKAGGILCLIRESLIEFPFTPDWL